MKESELAVLLIGKLLYAFFLLHEMSSLVNGGKQNLENC